MMEETHNPSGSNQELRADWDRPRARSSCLQSNYSLPALCPVLLRDFRPDLLGWLLHPVPVAHNLCLISVCLPSGSLQSSAKAGAACAARIIRVLQGA